MNEMVKRLTAERDEARAKNAGWEAQAHRHRELADAAEQDAARLAAFVGKLVSYLNLGGISVPATSEFANEARAALAAYEERVGGGK